VQSGFLKWSGIPLAIVFQLVFTALIFGENAKNHLCTPLQSTIGLFGALVVVFPVLLFHLIKVIRIRALRAIITASVLSVVFQYAGILIRLGLYGE
jgi:hypothetical protein